LILLSQRGYVTLHGKVPVRYSPPRCFNHGSSMSSSTRRYQLPPRVAGTGDDQVRRQPCRSLLREGCRLPPAETPANCALRVALGTVRYVEGWRGSSLYGWDQGGGGGGGGGGGVGGGGGGGMVTGTPHAFAGVLKYHQEGGGDKNQEGKPGQLLGLRLATAHSDAATRSVL